MSGQRYTLGSPCLWEVIQSVGQRGALRPCSGMHTGSTAQR